MIKYIKLALILIIALSFTAFGQQTKKDKAVDLAKSKEAEVKETFERLVEGINQSDVEKVMSVYHKDDKTLFFNYNGTATIGWQNMYDNRKSSYAKRTNVNLEITGLRVEILSPTSAYVSCKWKQSQEFEGALEQSTGQNDSHFQKVRQRLESPAPTHIA